MDKGQLTGDDSAQFDALLMAVEIATSSTLLQPDWQSNRLCIEGMNKIGKAEVAYEIGDVIRQKLKAPEPRVIILTLHLIDSFINECGQKWHIVMNDKNICEEIVFLSRNYWRKTGSENVAVVDACTDLIQSWGEAFLPHRKQYPNIVDMYLVLRQVGFPFKTNNLKHENVHQVPGFATQQPYVQPQSRVPPPHQRNPSDPTGVDAAIAASLQASLNLDTNHNSATRGQTPPQHPASRGTPANSTSVGYDSCARLPDNGARSCQGSIGTRHVDSPSNRPINATCALHPTKTSGNATVYPISALALINSIRSADNLLRDLLAAANSAEEIRRNELAADIAAQLQTNQTKINLAVEQCMNDGELVERLFRVNDDSQALIILYQEIKNGNISLAQGKQRLNLGSRAVSPQGEGIATSAASSRHHHSAPQATTSLPPPAPSAPQYSPNHSARAHNKQMKNGRIDSLEGDLTVITSEADPFAPQAIDALFEISPSLHTTISNNTHNNNHNNNYINNDHNKLAHVTQTRLTAPGVVVPAGHPPPPADIPAKALRNIDSDLHSLDGTVIAASGDPFAPEALDALLGTKKSHQEVNRHYPPPQQLGDKPPHLATVNHQMHQQYHQPIPPNMGYAPGYPQPYPIPPHQLQQQQHAQYMQPIQRQQYPAVISAVPALQVQVPTCRGGGSAPNSANGSPSQHKQQQHQPTASQTAAAKDPFSPAALDALFTGPTIPVGNNNGVNAVHPRIAQLQQEGGRNSGPNSGRNSPCGAARQHHQITNSAIGSATKPHANTSSATPRDPFSPEALDAMLGLTPSNNVIPHHHPHPSNSNNNSRSHSPRVGYSTAANNNVASPRDPFSPEALDALFDPVSSTKTAPVPPHQHPHQHPHSHHPSQQQQHQQQQQQQQQHNHYAQQYLMQQQVSPQLSPHGHMMPGYFHTPVMPALPMPGMMYVTGPNGMIYTAPANIPPPPGYYPIPNNNIHHH